LPQPLTTRLKHAWNAFKSRDPTRISDSQSIGQGSFQHPGQRRYFITSERSVILSIYNRIAMDVAAVNIQHVKLDDNDRYSKTIDSGLNYVLTQEANIDQTARAFIQDLVMSMFDEGVVAAVPIDTTLDPTITGAFDINTIRVGRILEWYPRHVKVHVYNDATGKKEPLVLPKERVAIIENPLYAVMNEPNGTLKRLLRKLAILDAIDEQSGAGKLDIIIQLPYVIKTAARKAQAEERRKDIEMQLSGSKYGIAYTDGTERITQLNRPAENNLMKQIEYLMSVLYSQLGLTEAVFNGTANEAAMLNYNNRTVLPLVMAIVEEFRRSFLTRTARTQKQSIMSFKDAFSLVPATQLADIADKFTRNEILSSNEFRALIGYKPVDDEKADALMNKNIAQPDAAGPTEESAPTAEETVQEASGPVMDEQDVLMNELLDGLSADIDDILGGQSLPSTEEEIQQKSFDEQDSLMNKILEELSVSMDKALGGA